MGLARPARRRCVDIAQPEVCALGGVSEYLRVRDLAHSRFVPVVNHVWGSAVAIALNIHLLVAMPDLPGAMFARTPMLELDTTPNRFRDELLVEPLELFEPSDVTARSVRRAAPDWASSPTASSSPSTRSEVGAHERQAPRSRGREAAGPWSAWAKRWSSCVPSDGLRLDEAATYAIGPAGAESNVAISLARLGTAVEWAGLVGDDPLGVRLRRDVESYGVSTASRGRARRAHGNVRQGPGPHGSQVYYYRAGSAAALMDADYAATVMDSRPRWVHLTGVTPALSTACEQAVRAVVRRAREPDTVVSFDVNYRAVLWHDVLTAGS